MRAASTRFFFVWFALLGVHGAMALIPFAVHPSKETALVPYYSYFGVLALLSKLGINAFSEFKEGMFMAPVSTTGKVAVATVWLLLHACLAATALCVLRRRRSDPQ